MPTFHHQYNQSVISLDAERGRRHDIALALANEDWQQTVACFALEGLPATDEDAGRAGRVIAGALTLEQALAQVCPPSATRQQP